MTISDQNAEFSDLRRSTDELATTTTFSLRSSKDEDSCVDETISEISSNSLKVSDDGTGLPKISSSSTIPMDSIPLPISDHLSPTPPFSHMVEQVKLRGSDDETEVEAVKDKPIPVEKLEGFKLVATSWSAPLNAMIPTIDVDQGKKEFSVMQELNEAMFNRANGYESDKVSQMLCNNRYLINRHTRWSNISPWSHNIVTLKTPIEDDFFKTSVSYFNASHIELEGEKFISCSAPLPASFEHFWQMIFEQGSNTVVMLTKFLEKRTIKAHCYWPSKIGKPAEIGSITVTLTAEQARKADGEETDNLQEANIVKRSFQLTYNGETRQITHLQYREWPDFGRPQSTDQFITLMNEVDAQETTGPIITHCSAGCGRAGTFITTYAYLKRILNDIKNCEHSVDHIFKNYTVNVATRVLKIREQRPGMVQQVNQYLFIKEVIATLVHEELTRLKTLEQS
jgi:protein tyrosine phosphatase